MTISEVDCQILLNEWHEKYIGNNCHYPSFTGFENLGNSIRGITRFHNYPRYGKIALNSKLKSNWRIKAILWHEFCHHWAYSVYNYYKHQGKFDECLRTDKVLWLLGSFSRIIPML